MHMNPISRTRMEESPGHCSGIPCGAENFRPSTSGSSPQTNWFGSASSNNPARANEHVR